MSAAQAHQVIHPLPGLSAERPPAHVEETSRSGAAPESRGADRRRSGLITLRRARRAPAAPAAAATPAAIHGRGAMTPTVPPASLTASTVSATAVPGVHGATTTVSPASPELTAPAALTTPPSSPMPLSRPPGRMRRLVSAARERVRRIGLRWVLLARERPDAGMSTAEYAVGTLAACGFAALLWKVVTSAEVKSMLIALIQRALKVAG
jgi:hypothetical protein